MNKILLIVSIILLATNSGAFAGVDPRFHPLRVDCDRGQSVQKAIDKAKEGTTVQVSGTCAETVLITSDGLTLEGINGATFNGAGLPTGDVDQAMINVVGASNVTLSSLRVINSPVNGVTGRNGAVFTMDNMTISHSAFAGVRLSEGADTRISASDVFDNAESGINVFLGAQLFLLGATPINVERNGSYGILMVGSNLFVADTELNLNENALDGLLPLNGSSVGSIRSVINAIDNGRAGVNIFSGSDMDMYTGVTMTVSGNGGQGVNVSNGATFTAFDGSALVSTDNQWGALVGIGSSFQVLSAASADLSSNSSQGLGVSSGSSVRLDATAAGPVTIDNNTFGIIANTNAVVHLEDAAGANLSVSGNLVQGINADNTTLRIVGGDFSANGLDIALHFGTRATLNPANPAAVSIFCDPNVLSQGSVVCPP